MKKLSLFVCCWLLAGPFPVLRAGSAADLTATVSATEPTHVEVRTWIEQNIPILMTESRMPGFSIAVVKDGETIYAEGFGSRNPELNLPATADTLYGIGSITKSFVAIGIMQLVEAGKVDLDDPVSQHIPFELGLPGDPTRIRHLMTHSLGIPSLASSTVAISRGLGRLEVVVKGGMLYLEHTSPLTGASTSTPLVPEDPTLESTTFYTVRNGLKRTIDFTSRDQGSLDLFVGRYCYHKVD